MQPLAGCFFLLVKVSSRTVGKILQQKLVSVLFSFHSAERNHIYLILVCEVLCVYPLVLDPPAWVVLQTKHSLFGKWNKGISFMWTFHQTLKNVDSIPVSKILHDFFRIQQLEMNDVHAITELLNAITLISVVS